MSCDVMAEAANPQRLHHPKSMGRLKCVLAPWYAVIGHVGAPLHCAQTGVWERANRKDVFVSLLRLREVLGFIVSDNCREFRFYLRLDF
jgi:hypothetical protein